MIVAVVPLKRLSEAKSRLGTHLAASRRASMMIAMLGGVVSALRTSGVIDRIALVTPETQLCERFQVDLVEEQGNLNASLGAGVTWAVKLRASSVLILPADLPRVSGADIRALVGVGRIPTAVAISPTKDGGTGALLLTPPSAIVPSFGPDSFHRHLALARAAEIPTTVVERAGLSFDVDTLDDLLTLGACSQ